MPGATLSEDRNQLIDWDAVNAHHQLDGYNISELINLFANVTRYGTNLKPLYNATLFEGKAYGESMAIYGVFAAAGLIVLTLCLGLFCCLNILIHSSSRFVPRRKSSNSSCVCNVIVLILAVLGAGTFAVGFAGERKFHRAADSICNTTKFVFNRVDQIKTNADGILLQSNITTLISQLKGEIDQSSVDVTHIPDIPTDISNLVNNYSHYAANIVEQVTKAEETLRQRIKLDLLEDAVTVMHTANEECPSIATTIEASTLVLFSFLALTSLLFCLALCCACIRPILCGFGYLIFVLLIALGTAAFVVLIVGSDFCLTSKRVLTQYVETPVTITDYYLYCSQSNHSRTSTHDVGSVAINESINIPFLPTDIPTLPTDISDILNGDSSPQIDQLFEQVRHFFEQSKRIVRQFKNDTDWIDHWCQLTNSTAVGQQAPLEDLCNHVAKIGHLLVASKDESNANQSLLNRLEQVSDSMEQVIDIVDCRAVTPEINGALTNVCTTLYESFFYLLLNSASATLCFLLLLLSTIWLIYRAKALEDDEFLPSAPTSANLNQRHYLREFSWAGRTANQHAKTTVL